MHRSLSQASVATEDFADPVCQAAIAEECFIEPQPLFHVDSQSSSCVSVVSIDCTSSGTRQSKVQKLHRDNARLKKRNDILVSKLRLHEEAAHIQRMVDKRPSTGFLVAMARNIGNGSALSAACWSCLLQNKKMTRQTVVKWEHDLATSILAGMVRFHIQHESDFRRAKDCIVVLFLCA